MSDFDFTPMFGAENDAESNDWRSRYQESREEHYTLTATDEPLSGPDQASDSPSTRLYFSKLDDAVKAFNEYCATLDVGCVQLWDGNYETGKLYL